MAAVRIWSAISDGGPPSTGAANRLSDGVAPQPRDRLAAVTSRLSPAIATASPLCSMGSVTRGSAGSAAVGRRATAVVHRLGKCVKYSPSASANKPDGLLGTLTTAPASPPASASVASGALRITELYWVAPMAANGVQYRTPSRTASAAISSFTAAAISVTGAAPGAAVTGRLRTAPAPWP